MPFEYVPLLETQREIYLLPRGMERFRDYLKTMLNAEGDDLELVPMVTMNPMAKEHALAYVEALLSMNAEEVARIALEEAQTRLPHFPEPWKVSLIVLDDLKGGWTNRHTTLFADWAMTDRARANFLRYAWISVGLWTSEPPSPKGIRREVFAQVYKALWALRHPKARTLHDVLRQEAYALAFAGQKPWLDEEELAYTRAVLEPHLESDHYPTLVAALYGDEAAKSLGYPPLGLSARAGFALGLVEVLESEVRPEDALTL
ncbi:MAG: hypothetical protein K6T35_00725 [Meiothermus silvanus]|nr:hypothetical protein [Allomeiothermus silvanus]MCL6567433.1 hypothetical protein [Allomeiothermus silvanus]